MTFHSLYEEMFSFLMKIVQINSDTGNFEGIRDVIDSCIPHFHEIGFQTEIFSKQHLIARKSGDSKPRVLILGHMDTYRHLDGPFMDITREGDILKGHGVSDMKAGIAVVLFGLKYLKALGGLEERSVTVIFNSDEETGSEISRQIIEDEACGHDIVLVFEGGKRIDEKRTTFVIERQGLASANYMFDSPASNVSDGFGGGNWHTENDKIEKKRFHVEFPFKDFSEIDKVYKELKYVVEQTRNLNREFGKEAPSRIEIKIMRPPMIPTQKTLEYSSLLEKIGEEIGHLVVPRTRPGMSDGCFTAALGIPTLDGMGPVGTNWHTKDEYLEIPTLKARMELFVTFWKKLFVLEGECAREEMSSL